MTKITLDRATVEQTIEALEYYYELSVEDVFSKSISALKAALAAPIIQPEIKDDKEPRLLPWKGLTEEEHTYYKGCGFVGVKAVEEKLRARNSTLACHQGEEGK